MKDFLGDISLGWVVAFFTAAWTVYQNITLKAQLKATVRKTEAEGRKAETESNLNIVRMQRDYISDMEKKYSDLHEDYVRVVEGERGNVERIHTLEMEMQNMRNQISLLKSKIKQQ